jgi:Tfp pilus assembly protein PilO
MRLLVELLIIAAVIYLGWTKPFSEQVAQANRTITNQLHSLGKGLQKHEDPSVRRH